MTRYGWVRFGGDLNANYWRRSVVGLMMGLIACLGFAGTATAQDKAVDRSEEKVDKQDTDQDASQKDEKEEPVEFAATHKQSKIFKPTHKGDKIALHTLCIDNDGNLLAGVGGTSSEYVYEDGKAKMKKTESPAMIQVYSHEQKLIREMPISVTPTAVNVDKSGNIYVGGDGKVLKLSPKGETLVAAASPALMDPDELKKQIRERLEKQFEEMVGSTKKQIEALEKKVAKIEETAEEDRTKRQKTQLKSFKSTLKMLNENNESLAEYYKPTEENVEQAVKQSNEIRSIAVNENHVYVTCASPGTFGYEIWRMNRQLAESHKVIDEANGCCGQLDIQAADDHLFIADNTKFRVAKYDKDGKLVDEFGKRTTGEQSGFGSCCNPMNIRCCDNGEVLTAESSIGHIKRFDSKGNLVGYVGRAKIGGGCKHVAMGHDSQHDIYYMMYQDEGAICVLEPTEKVGETQDDIDAREAAEGLGKKIVGRWEFVPADGDKKAEADAKTDAESGDEQEVPIGASIESMIGYVEMNFVADGKLKTKLPKGAFQTGWDLSWQPTKQKDATLSMDLVDADGIQMMRMKTKFINDDEIEVAINFSGAQVEKRTYRRKK